MSRAVAKPAWRRLRAQIDSARLCLVIRKAETARLHSGPEKRFPCLEESPAVPLPDCQTQPGIGRGRRGPVHHAPPREVGAFQADA
jgi:hypothetical protein